MACCFSKIKFWPFVYWTALAVAALILLNHHVFSSDDGVALAGAWDLFNGQKMYYDIFQFTPPAVYFLIYAVWKIFGVSYLSAKLLSTAAIILSLVGIYKISGYLNPSSRYSAYWPPLLFLAMATNWSLISYHTFNILCLIWATYFLLKSYCEPRLINIISAGILTGTGALFLLHRTIIFLLAALFFFWIIAGAEKNWYYIKISVAYLFFSITLLFGLLLFWSPGLLFTNLVVFPLFHYSAINKFPFGILAFLLIILLFLAWLLNARNNRLILGLSVIQLSLLISTYSRPDYYHLTLVAFPLLIVLPLAWQEISRLQLVVRFFAQAVTIVILALFIWPSLPYLLDLPRLTVKKNNYLINFIKNNCQATAQLYAGPFLPYLYFETLKRNPLPYSWLLTGLHTTEQFLTARQLLEKDPPACAVLNYQEVEKFNYNRNNPVDEFIKNNYQLALRWNNFLIFKKI